MACSDSREVIPPVDSGHSERAVEQLGAASTNGSVVVSQEYTLDNPVWSGAPERQWEPVVVAGTSGYLAVWADARRAGLYEADIFASRVSASGQILDPGGIVIAVGSSSQVSPSVAFDGANFLVVWSDDFNRDIRGRRVSPSGVVLDSQDIVIGDGRFDRFVRPAVAFDGTNYIVVWDVYRSSRDVLGARVDPAGQVLDTTPIPIATTNAHEFAPAVASGAGTTLVTWTQGETAGDVYASRVDGQGAVLDTSGIPVSTASGAQGRSDVTSDGSQFVVAWRDARSTNTGVYISRVDAAGSVLDPSGVAVGSAASYHHTPSVASDGSVTWVLWSGYHSGVSRMLGRRIDKQAALLDAAPVPLGSTNGEQVDPAVACDAQNFFAVWQSGPPVEWDVVGQRITSGGSLADTSEFTVSTAPNGQYDTDLATDGTHSLVVWRDRRSDPDEIYAARVDAAGTLLDPNGISIADGGASELGAPSVAFNGTNYVVAWSNWDRYSYDIRAARVAVDGTVLDATPIRVVEREAYQQFPAVSSDGTNALVVWSESSTSVADVHGARISASGQVLDPGGIRISTTPGMDHRPAIDFNGTNYLVGWMNSANATYDIYATRVSPTGSVLDGAGVVVTAGHTGGAGFATIASDGTDFIVVWRSGEIYAARVSAAGGVLDNPAIAVTAAASSEDRPDVTYDGTNYVIVWENDRSGDSQVYAARVDPTGGVLDVNGFGVTPAAAHSTRPAVERVDQDKVIVTYQSQVAATGFSPRARLRFISKNALPVAAAKSVTTQEDVAVAIQLEATDADGDALSYSIVDAPDSGTLTGTGPNVTYTPDPEFSGQDAFVFRASDGHADSNDATVTISVVEVNDAPNVSSDIATTATEDVEYRYEVEASDPEGDSLSYALATTDGCGGVVDAAGVYTFVPMGPTPPADCTVGVQVCDDGSPGECVEQSAVVMIEAVNDAPMFVEPTPSAGATIEVDDQSGLRVELAGSDPEGDALSFGLAAGPNGAGVDAGLGELYWSPSWMDAGSHEFDIYVSDGEARDERRLVVNVTVIDGDDGTMDALDEDTDGDGVEDADDLCPLVAGAGADGCDVPASSDDADAGCGCGSAGSGGSAPVALIVVLIVGVASMRRRAAALLVGSGLATLAFLGMPSEAVAQKKIEIDHVELQVGGAGLTGYVDFFARAGCVGERRLQMRTRQVVIQGVNYNGQHYSGDDIHGFQFPMHITGQGGLVYLRGSIGATEGGRIVFYPIQSGSISDKLEGFMDWVTMAPGNKLEEFGCREWTEFVDSQVSSAVHKLVIFRTDNLGDGLFWKLKHAIDQMEALDKRLLSLGADLEEAETSDDYRWIIETLEEMEGKDMSDESAHRLRMLLSKARLGLDDAEREEAKREQEEAERAEAQREREEEREAEAEAADAGGGGSGGDNDREESSGEERAEADGADDEEDEEDESEDESDDDDSDDSDGEPRMMSKAEQEHRARMRELERQRKIEDEEQRRREAYARWKEQQDRENAALAASSAASSAMLLYLLGDMIYSGMGQFQPEDAFDGTPSLHIGAEFGYSFMLAPMYFNSSTFDGVDSFEATEHNYSWPVNFDLKLMLGYESENFGGFAFGKAAIGTTIIFNSYLFPAYEFGAQIYGGHRVVQGFLQYSRGGRQTFVNHWYVAGESGTGKSAVGVHTLKIGAKFTWNQFEREHLRVGLAMQGLKVKGEGERQDLQKLDPLMPNSLYLPGLFVEYRKDHSFSFYANLYPTYPYTGDVASVIEADDPDKGGVFFSVGFLRAFDGFI